MSDLYEYIGQKIRELRRTYPKGNLSQEALAKELGVPANTLSRWETGTYKPSAVDLDKLSRFFEVSITVFFPDLEHDDARISALTSATSGLDSSDFDEIVRYAEYRKAYRAMKTTSKKRSKK